MALITTLPAVELEMLKCRAWTVMVYGYIDRDAGESDAGVMSAPTCDPRPANAVRGQRIHRTARCPDCAVSTPPRHPLPACLPLRRLNHQGAALTAPVPTWAPPRRPLTADVIRRVADLIETRDLALTSPHPLYPADGVSVPAAVRAACDELGGWYPHVEAVVALTMYGYAGDVEPGTTTEAAVAALREAADAWQASPDHTDQVATIAADRRRDILVDGVAAWAHEWADAHDDDDDDDALHVAVAPGEVAWPGCHSDIPLGSAPRVHGGHVTIMDRATGRRVAVDWADLVAVADTAHTSPAQARGAVRELLTRTAGRLNQGRR